jgi:hypothetical protein
MSSIIFTAGYLSCDDDLMSMKGHRSDILYQDDEGLCYELNFITLERLAVELKYFLEQGIRHYAETGLVILDVINKSAIVKAVQSLIEKRYFITQKPLRPEPQDGWFFVRL